MIQKKERNAPCPCGSGKKYKKCCWEKEAGKAFKATLISKMAADFDEKRIVKTFGDTFSALGSMDKSLNDIEFEHIAFANESSSENNSVLSIKDKIKMMKNNIS